jgi:hypothetical protein
MGFSRSQQGLFRPMITKAWEIHCEKNGLDKKDKPAKDRWYRNELLVAIGIESTSDAHPGRDFETCMAHFETICGDSVHWNMRVFKGDAARIIFSIGQICKKHTISEPYVLGTARKMLQRPGLQSLAEVERSEDLARVRVALLMHAKRMARAKLLQEPTAEALPETSAEPANEAAPEPNSEPATNADNCPF